MRLALVLLLIACPALASAQTLWFVDSGACPGPGSGTRQDPFCSIQDAIDASAAGDTVLVLAGLYREPFDYVGKAILVRSDLDGDPLTCDPAPDVTIISASGSQAVTFSRGEGRESILQGFTLRDGHGTFGGGIRCLGTSPSIVGNILYRNGADWGGGVYCEGGSPLIASNIIRQNSARAGGGIYCTHECTATLTNNTILENRAGLKGGGIACRQGSRLFIRNTILRQNEAPAGPAISIAGESAWLRLSFSDIEGGEASVDVRSGGELEWGEGNIDEDPQFANVWSGDFHLSPTSPCVDSGEKGGAIGELPELDIDAEPRICLAAVDMGADEFWTVSTHSFQPPDSMRAVWFVDDDNLPGPGSGRPADPFVRIRDAIGAADESDTVLVLPGVYAEYVDFRGKAITLRSDADGDPSTCDLSDEVILEGSGEYTPLVSLAAGEGRDSVVEGLTFTNAPGAGIWCKGSSPTIRGNTFRGCAYGIKGEAGGSPLIVANRFLEGDGGVSAYGSSATIADNLFDDTRSAIGVSGAAIVRRNTISRCRNPAISAYSRALIVGNTLTGNENTGISCTGAIVLSNVITGTASTYKIDGGGIRVSGDSLIADNLITGNAAGEGGGIWIEAPGKPIIRHNTVSQNTATAAGGGIFVDSDARPLIEGNTVAGNSARRKGGGIACAADTAGTIQDNTITENSARDGGGIMCSTIRVLEIRRNRILSNRASGRGGGIGSAANSQLVIEENELEGNTAEREGGAISCYVGGRERIAANRMSKNVAKLGGAVFLYGAAATLEHNTMSSNQALAGGAVYGAYGVALDCLGNVFLGNAADAGGGGILADGSVLTLRNNTFTRNRAGEVGGGLACSNLSQATLVNEIFWEDQATVGEEIYVGAESSTLSVSYSDLDLTRVFVKSGCTLEVGPGMIAADPLFVDVEGGDLGPSRESPCIDAADPAAGPCDALDLSGTPRVLDGALDGIRRTDMGAREFGHVHLEIEGALEPGGRLRIATSGTSGLFVFLFAGKEETASCVEPFGPLFLDLARASWFPLGVIPDEGRLEVELSLPGDLLAPASGYLFQELGVTPALARGNVSNPLSMRPLAP
ncbi:MAG: right-handed parallel beta-helix repeat-containing protein [Planctomycetota bacterium]